MFEHVGPKNYRAYFEKIYNILKPGGLFLLHTFGSVISSPTLRQPEVEWIKREIFPGGVIPSFCQIASASDNLFTLLDAQEFGYYYYPTLMAWRDNFERGWPEIQHLYDARFYRLWRYYPSAKEPQAWFGHPLRKAHATASSTKSELQPDQNIPA